MQKHLAEIAPIFSGSLIRHTDHVSVHIISDGLSAAFVSCCILCIIIDAGKPVAGIAGSIDVLQVINHGRRCIPIFQNRGSVQTGDISVQIIR